MAKIYMKILDRIQKYIKNNYLNIIILLIYFFVHLIMLFRHEMWRDEAQAYMIVKNASLIELFYLLRVEGHPILWFLFILPFAKLGIPFEYFGYISLITSSISVYIFLSYSTFPKTVNFIVLLSSSFLYFNAVISRVYCLTLLICVLICSVFEKRFEKPCFYMILVSLLLQTHIKICGLAIGLALEFAYSILKDNKKGLFKYLWIPIFSFLFLFIELIPFGSYRPFINVELNAFLNIKEKIRNGLGNFAYTTWLIADSKIYYFIICLFAFLGVLFVIALIKNKHFKDYFGYLFILICSLSAYFIITFFIYGNNHRQIATLFSMIVLVNAYILYSIKDKIIKNIVIISIVLYSFLSIKPCLVEAKNDWQLKYSCGKETAFYIANELNEDDYILVSYDLLNPLVCAYTSSFNDKIIFYDVVHNCEYKYHQWSEEIKLTEDEILLKAISYSNKTDKKCYYLSSKLINNPHFKLVYSNLEEENIWQENYVLYLLS